MANLFNQKMDEILLKTIDSNFTQILETASRITLYNFTKKGWKKCFAGAAVCVYRCTGEPIHNLVIVNNNRMRVIIEPINQGLELDLQNPPMLSYKNDKGLTHGIKFRGKEDFDRIASLLEYLFREVSAEKAKEECNHKGKSLQENGTIPESVMDSFAKPQFIPPPSQDTRLDVIQRLKSNPAYSVEYIEKQQLNALVGNRNSKDVKLQESGGSSQVSPLHSRIQNGMEFLGLRESLPTNCVQRQQFFKFNVIQRPTISNVPFNDNTLEKPCPSTSQTGTAVKIPTKPACLVPPMVITSSATKNISADYTKATLNVAPIVSINQDTLVSLQPPPITGNSLTTNQILLAINYLLKEDPYFIYKLHEAYFKATAENLLENCKQKYGGNV